MFHLRIWGLNTAVVREVSASEVALLGHRDTGTCVYLGLWGTVGSLQARPRRRENLKQAQGKEAEKNSLTEAAIPLLKVKVALVMFSFPHRSDG